ncbi:SRPBCC family protein [Alkalihalobacillus sp. TS-13]|uniref:SRPBCC family protein n=1 Tax=Alkalihalobacillus sp. TS-13 TaxID=2842455 RepID=UPI001C883946|nr:SRPBCC family protein [Alkalihalobacillus sp. TS-13]
MSNHTFVYATYIATTPEKLWEVLTSGEFTKKYFFGREVQSDWEEGAEVKYLRGNGELDVSGKVLNCEPYCNLSFTWIHAEDSTERSQPTIVTFELTPMDDTVKLTLIHENLLEVDYTVERDTFRGYNNGWPAILSNLKSYLETGKTLQAVQA